MLFFSVFSSIFHALFKIPVKIGFFVGDASQNAFFSLKIGFAPKRPCDNFAPGKKRTRRLQGTPFLGIDSVFSFSEKNGRNH